MPDNLKRVLFIDRDGTLILEPEDEQIDSFAKLKFYPGALQYLPRIAKELDFELILVSNQDGLGTSSHPEENFWPVHHFVIDTFAGEGVVFAEEHIDKTFPHENAKPENRELVCLELILIRRNTI
jgi:imidazoleglycerol-phosphate dehydratase/histidinol-phosphatase